MKFDSLRKERRFFVFGRLKINYERIPDYSMIFSYRGKNADDQNFPTYNGKDLSTKGRALAEVNHPNLVFGYNPKENFFVGVVDFKRNNFRTTNQMGIYASGGRSPIEYQNAVQAMGRLTRHSDSNALLFC